MQLFLLDHIDLKWHDIILDHPEVWQQAKKVLRLWSGDRIFVQRQAENQQAIRYEVEVTALKDFKLFGTVVQTMQSDIDEKAISMIVAMPNKREKAELIVQKLTEIGVNEIIFRPSERSIIRERNANKATRLEKIMKEALEQSRGWKLPKISFVEKIEPIVEWKNIVLFDKSEWPSTWRPDGLYGLVGPEGGRWPKDYELFKQYDIVTKDLGSTILRMETAAIVGAWVLKNLL